MGAAATSSPDSMSACWMVAKAYYIGMHSVKHGRRSARMIAPSIGLPHKDRMQHKLSTECAR